MSRIKELRLQTGKQQKEVAKELGIPVSTFAGYERGEREPKLNTWKKIADYFDVDVTYLQGISNIPRIDDYLKTNIVAPGIREVEVTENAVNDNISIVELNELAIKQRKEKITTELIKLLHYDNIDDVNNELADFDDRVSYAISMQEFSNMLIDVLPELNENPNLYENFMLLNDVISIFNNLFYEDKNFPFSEFASELRDYINEQPTDDDNQPSDN